MGTAAEASAPKQEPLYQTLEKPIHLPENEFEALIQEADRIKKKFAEEQFDYMATYAEYLSLRGRIIQSGLISKDDLNKIENSAINNTNQIFYPESQRKFNIAVENIGKQINMMADEEREKCTVIEKEYDKRFLFYAAWTVTTGLATLASPVFFPYFMAGLVVNVIDLLVTTIREFYHLTKKNNLINDKPNRIAQFEKNYKAKLEKNHTQDGLSQRFFKLRQDLKEAEIKIGKVNELPKENPKENTKDEEVPSIYPKL